MIHLNDRAVLKISGADSRKFLQGLITNDINKLTSETAIYTALQTPQGKYLFDFILYGDGDEILLDIENSRAPELLKKLGIYKLRSNILISPTDLKVYSNASKGVADPRNAKFGKRFITMGAQKETGTLKDYEKIRFELGIPESRDLIPEKSFINQNNFEELNAIDYNKGCYVGQELVARVKYKGNISRRIFKVTGEGALPEFGTPIMQGEKLIGEMRSSLGNIGLAQCLVEANTNVEYMADSQKIKLQTPQYLT